MEFISKHKARLLFILVIVFGSALRLYRLNWGSPYFFHPDERNIAGSISQMYWEKTLNPHFFAYGSFWSYIVLFLLKVTGPFVSFVNTRGAGELLPTDPFAEAIFFLRLFAAFQGIGLIVISYFIAKLMVPRIFKFQIPNFKLLLLPLLIATSPGFIQASHFGTFEQSLAFLYTLIFYLCCKFLQTKKIILWFLISIIFGISVSIRVTSTILLPIVISCLIFARKKSLVSPLSLICLFSFFLLSIVIFYFSNPFSFQQFNNPPAGEAGLTIQQLTHPFSSDLLGAMRYESDVALGKMNVFYTQQFQQTTPIIYQFFRVLPFVLNPLVWALFVLSIIIPAASFISRIPNIISACMRSKSVKIQAPNMPLILTLLFFGATFFSGSMLFVKWTRYIIPSLPFIYILVFLFLLRIPRRFLVSLIPFLSLLSLIFSFLFVSVYSSDTRVTAARWAKDNLKPNTKIISEVYDMGIVPFNDYFHYRNIVLFNFYDMDDKFGDEANLTELQSLLAQADAVILPSRRVVATRQRLAPHYPNGNWFYKNLFEGKLGFKLAKTFSHPYDKIFFGVAPDESFTVFDHPDIYIFKKI